MDIGCCVKDGESSRFLDSNPLPTNSVGVMVERKVSILSLCQLPISAQAILHQISGTVVERVAL